jgi:hypothetical protein
MGSICEEPDAALATAAKLVDAKDLREAATILRSSQARFEQTDFDNWNGGTNVYVLYLSVSPEEFARLGNQRELLCMQADRREPAANHPQLRRLDSVSIVPQLEQNTAWRSDHGGISRNTRQLIVDRFRLEGIPWTGALGEIEFLERIFDLKQLPVSMPANDP